LLQRLREQSAGLANLEWVGFVPYSAVDPYFDGARLLLNTSVIEGFPNTFLQAWARGVPSISFFDNGSRHQGQPVTRTVADLDAMAAAVAQWMGDDLSWQGASARVRDYFEASHTPAVALRAYQQVFAALDGE
jgi:glycosyltransferase involved in cell wall biosynthesis